MRKRHSGLLATAAAAALVCGLTGSASAFDVVDWSWDANIQEDWDIDVTISVDYDPTGIVKIEKLQMHFGDVNSFAKVFGIENNPPVIGTGEGTVIVPIAGSGTFDLTYNDPGGGGPNAGQVNEITVVDPSGIGLNLSGGSVTEDGNAISDIAYSFSGEVEVNLSDIEFGDPIDLAALPEVVNTATSVANNQQIVSSSALMLHDAQIAVGDINPTSGEQGTPDAVGFLLAAYLLTEVDDELDGINEHTDIAALTILGAATGFIEPADIDADAWAFFITNATVDNSATAVGNNASYEIATVDAANATMVADLTQLLIGDVNAVALAGGIEINNYDLTDIDAPIVKNVATAVGNNLNIKVGVGDSE